MVIEFDDVTKGDLTKYRDTDGWPIFIDDFVLFVKDNKSAKTEVNKL
jgi:hypothetical protein